MFCFFCGKPIELDAIFCTYCGNKVGEAVGQAADERAGRFGAVKAELNLKKGCCRIWSLASTVLSLLGGYLPLFLWVFLNNSGGGTRLLAQLGLIALGILIGLLGMLFPFLVKYTVFHAKGYAVKLHIGMITEVGATVPLSRKTYIVIELLSLIPLVLFTVVAIVFWFSPIIAAILIVYGSNVLTNIPVYAFILRQKASSRLMFDQGVMRAYE